MAVFPDLARVPSGGAATPEDKKRKFAETVNW
jgi:hypothetical protein